MDNSNPSSEPIETGPSISKSRCRTQAYEKECGSNIDLRP